MKLRIVPASGNYYDIVVTDDAQVESATLLYKYVLTHLYDTLPLPAKLLIQGLVRAKLEGLVKFKHGEDPVYTASETLLQELPNALKDAAITITTSANDNQITATHISVQLQSQGESW